MLNYCPYEKGVEGYRHIEQDYFNDGQKKLVEAWAHGIDKVEDAAAFLGCRKDTVDARSQKITDKMDEGPGTDRRAKAVTFAAQKGWVDPTPYPDVIERKLTDGEALVLTLRTLGFNRKEISYHLNISKHKVANNLDAVHRLLGNESDYFAIAWAILKVLKKPQPQKAQ